MSRSRLFKIFTLLVLADTEAFTFLASRQTRRPATIRETWHTVRVSPLFQVPREETTTDPVSEADFSFEEQKAIEDIHAKASDYEGDLGKAVTEALPNLSPNLIVKLRQSEDHSTEAVQQVAVEINNILETRMSEAKQTLTELLNAGEIRRLDHLIGKASEQGKLDVAFFNVLSMNMRDASCKQDSDEANEGAASRLQILQHILTRCQEEVEKKIPPETALLNKLLRTEQESIRANLYRHYLTPQPKKITTPDGKVVELQGQTPVLVPMEEFVEAIGHAVEQIRTVENAGATDPVLAASMVESVRQIAKEARLIIAEHYGMDSNAIHRFEDCLQPVFRPTSPDSPYVKGHQQS